MGITFVFSNEYNLGIEQLTAILKKADIPSGVVLSKYNFIEIAHLQYLAKHGEGLSMKKAQAVLAADASRMLDEIAKKGSDVVGFSVTTDSYQWCLAMARQIKARMPEIVTVMGGAHATFASERVIAQDAVDAICVGEMDNTVVDMYRALKEKNDSSAVPGLWTKRGKVVTRTPLAPIVQNLDLLPFRDISEFVRFNPNLGKTYVALTARGCPFNCSYCNSSSYKKMYEGKYLRKRSVNSMMEEMVRARKAYGYERVLFVDDVFTMDYKWLSEFLPVYKEKIGVPYYCLVHPDMVEENTIKLLKDTGCDTIKCGIQSISPSICKKIYNRSLNLDRVRRVIRQVKDAGIVIKVDFIIGAPTEKEEDLKDLINFIKEIKVDDIFLYFLKYYPGSRAIDYAFKNGYLSVNDYESSHEGMEIAYQIIPERFTGATRDLYAKYNRLIRDAAGSKFNVSQFNYLLEKA